MALFAALAAALVAAFAKPLWRLASFSASNELYSYIIIVPLLAAFLAWLGRSETPSVAAPERAAAFMLAALGGTVMLAYVRAGGSAGIVEPEDALSMTTLSFVLFFWALCAWFLGRSAIKSLGFPLGILILMAPLPVSARTWIEGALQQGSASVAHVFFDLAGTPVYYHNLSFQLTDITIEVAPECSGIHSTVALFITSLVAGYLFLRLKWQRTLLSLLVIPIAIIRNGFRVFTIGELCVHVGPEMIDSYIHRKGGPIFFVLSLIPFLLVLAAMARSERRPEARIPS